MERASEQKNVIQCCTNDILKNSLGQLQEGLEFCQKKLENYLETKRNIFPRFYFCSNEDLLKILSVGSDPNAVQDDFEKLFDAITHVTFDDQDRKLIVSIQQTIGAYEEEITLVEGVKAEGNIEEWLYKLEKEMQRSVRHVSREGAKDCFSMPLREFVKAYPSQIALLGIQMLWTNKVQDCLEKNQKEKLTELAKKKNDIDNLMRELTTMCLEEMNKLERTKVETLVTINVHQRDLFYKILDDAKQHKIRDANDFDWTKNTRIYWKHDEDHVAIQITDVEFIYSYEFLGAKERLCITPLTDRCYVTLS
jgi:dynein heavy chain